MQQSTTPTAHPTQQQLDAALHYELACAQIHALRTLVAISQDLSNPKEARIAATALLKFKLPAPPAPAEPTPQPTSGPAAPPTDADTTLDTDRAAPPRAHGHPRSSSANPTNTSATSHANPHRNGTHPNSRHPSPTRNS